MRRGRKPRPGALSRGSRNTTEPVPPDAQPRCPPHLDGLARNEWRRLANPLYKMGVLTVADRAAFAAYCQAYSRWAEAEQKLQETPMLLKTPSGYVQQSPWLSIANRQMELMTRFAVEMGLTPSARTRVSVSTREDQTSAIDFGVTYDSIVAHGRRINDRPGDVVEVTAEVDDPGSGHG